MCAHTAAEMGGSYGQVCRKFTQFTAHSRLFRVEKSLWHTFFSLWCPDFGKKKPIHKFSPVSSLLHHFCPAQIGAQGETEFSEPPFSVAE
jgi:predicted restriction endonuclease